MPPDTVLFATTDDRGLAARIVPEDAIWIGPAQLAVPLAKRLSYACRREPMLDGMHVEARDADLFTYRSLNEIRGVVTERLNAPEALSAGSVLWLPTGEHGNHVSAARLRLADLAATFEPVTPSPDRQPGAFQFDNRDPDLPSPGAGGEVSGADQPEAPLPAPELSPDEWAVLETIHRWENESFPGADLPAHGNAHPKSRLISPVPKYLIEGALYGRGVHLDACLGTLEKLKLIRQSAGPCDIAGRWRLDDGSILETHTEGFKGLLTGIRGCHTWSIRPPDGRAGTTFIRAPAAAFDLRTGEKKSIPPATRCFSLTDAGLRLARERALPTRQLREAKRAGQDKVRLGKEARALGLLADHPEWTDTSIANAVPCARSTLYKWRKYVQARAVLKESGRAGRRRWARGDTLGDAEGDTSDDSSWENAPPE